MKGFLVTCFFLMLGEFISGLLNLSIPGAILGMLFMLVYLSLAKGGNDSLHQIAERLLPLLPLFIIPTSVGIVTHWQLLKQNSLVLGVSVIASFVLLFVFSLLVLRVSKRLVNSSWT